jgi:hypothetical protein
MYIVRWTRLCLDDQIWGALRSRARREGTTISELIRRAVRERYLGGREQRMEAMKGLVGARQRRSAHTDSSEEVRNLRRGTRLDSVG